MEMPSVRTTVRDPRKGITYHVIAYRKLTRVEALAVVRHHQASPLGRKKHKAGDVVELHTIIGHDQ